MAAKWDSSWDAACLAKSLEGLARRFDPDYQLIKATIGPGFKIHSALSPGREVHETRGSAHYALELLERGDREDVERSCAILRELVANPDADPDSKTFGLWGYYHEEPAREMKPADYNWADFIGTVLLLTLHRHGAQLAPDLISLLRTAVERAAVCSIRRNVSMYYTNIAVKSTFLIVGAAELLGDGDLRKAADARLEKFREAHDATGSWAEFISPTYAAVSLTNFARMRQYWRREDARALAARLERRLWEHLARHWHAPTRQFTGPMSRCYRTDLRADAPVQALLQKATGGRLDFYGAPADLPGAGDVALHDLRCPEDITPRFVALDAPAGHRECYEPRKEGLRPLQGTVWKTPEYALGTVNRLDLWTQRRDLLLRWKTPDDGGARPPGRYATLRFLKDGYDFASAILVCAQNEGSALGVVSFARGTGDKHISLDVLKEGRFTASDLRLSLEFAGLGEAAIPRSFGPAGATLELARGLHLTYRVPEGLWAGAGVTRGAVRRGEGGAVGLDVVLHEGEARTFAWDDVRPAFVVFALSLTGGAADKGGGQVSVKREAQADGAVLVSAAWDSPHGQLASSSRADIPQKEGIYTAAREKVNDRLVPVAAPRRRAGPAARAPEAGEESGRAGRTHHGRGVGARVGGQPGRGDTPAGPGRAPVGRRRRHMRRAGVEVVWDSGRWGRSAPRRRSASCRACSRCARPCGARCSGAGRTCWWPTSGRSTSARAPGTRRALPGTRILYYSPPGSWRRTPRARRWRGSGLVATPFPWSETETRAAWAWTRPRRAPLLDLSGRASPESFARRHGIEVERPVVGLLPGSWAQEIAHILPVRLEAAAVIHRRVPGAQFRWFWRRPSTGPTWCGRWRRCGRRHAHLRELLKRMDGAAARGRSPGSASRPS